MPLRPTSIRPVVAALLCLGLLAACNTMEGLGKDIERAGQKLENSAQRHK